jgi:N-sulfoglucosamine sulfohydrolase
MSKLLSLCAALFLAASASAADRPLNLLLITADDMNADSVGWMGCKLPTPNLDSFVATCHRFINHHVTAPICQPCREALMTGRVPHRNGGLGFNPINPDVPTLVEVLRARGYFTAAINKVPHMAPRTKFPWDLALDGSGKNPKAMGEHAAQALKAAADAAKPFFINANITDPHRPFPGGTGGDGENELAAKKKRGSKNQQASSDVKPYELEEVPVPAFLEDVPNVRKEVAQYFTGVRRFDLSFGEVIGALKASRHFDDTLIVFLSDHGMAFPFSKATVYRNGTWSPVILRWPGMGKPVEDRTHLVSSVDIMPTVLDVLGVPKPDGLDGRSWLPLLRGQPQPDRDFVITHVNTVSSGKAYPGRCVRTLTRSYIWQPWPDGGKTLLRVNGMAGLSFNAMAKAGETDSRIKARVEQYHRGVTHGFYDLENDPDERNNLFSDPKQKDEITRLQKLLLAHMEKTNDPQLEAFKKALAGL